MKLYYSPGACSMAPHIVLNELEIPFTAEKVDLKAHTYSGGDFYKVNSKGSVPCLLTDEGQLLTEGVVITQYLADKKLEKHLVPKFGTFERYQLMELANYLASEVHKAFSPLFHPDMAAEAREKAKTNLGKKLEFLNKKLVGHPFLTGNQFTVCDAYLFVMLNWAKNLKFDLKPFPELLGFAERVAARPAVQKTMKEEGLTH